VGVDSALVEREENIMTGALRFTGTRVPLKSLLDYLQRSSWPAGFIEDFPSVSRDHAVAVLEAARQIVATDASAA
jgi:uncharacterized protein (DUF433 family)